jgi:hypothetical protein
VPSRFPLHRRGFALALPVLLCAACVSSADRRDVAPAGATRAPAQAQASTPGAPESPAGADALARWREDFPALFDALGAIDFELGEHESADSPPPPRGHAALSAAAGLLPRFELKPGQDLVLPAIHGPETSFPDHHPLRQLAALRTVQARASLAAGDPGRALLLVRQNLAQARAVLRSQEGIIPLIHAAGIWQSSLEGAHALARHPGFEAREARALLAELQADSTMAQTALARAFRGEQLHVYRVVVERMPKTNDPDLALSAMGSLGMAPAEPSSPDEIGLGLTEHLLLDPAATLEAYEADLAPYLAAFAESSRFPRGLYLATTATTLAGYHRELGAFFDYAGGDGPVTLELALRARAAMEQTANPVGKLLAFHLTPAWESLIAFTLRREAQRAAVCALLAWRAHGRPAPWHELVAAGLIEAPPADPFSDGPLLFETGSAPRVWSVYLNGKDEGGVAVPGNIGQPDDLVWIF